MYCTFLDPEGSLSAKTVVVVDDDDDDDDHGIVVTVFEKWPRLS